MSGVSLPDQASRNETAHADPVEWITTVLRDPETGRPFVLYPAQERWLREALTPTEDGRLPYEELVFSAPKKSGKTALSAMALLYVVVVLGGPFAEGYAIANDLEQAQGRVFQAAVRMVQASPLLRRSARITASRIEFPSSGAFVQAIASDYAGAAGANPSISCFDELWAFTSERSFRLWDEMVPPPTRRVACRLTVTYAGFEGESKLLTELRQRGLEGTEVAPSLFRQPGMLMAWHHDPVAPWQGEAWLAQMRRQLRPNAYIRMIENRFVSGGEQFIPVERWDRAASLGRREPRVGQERRRSVVLGVDAATKRDSAAVVACGLNGQRVAMLDHRVYTPRPGEPLDLEETLEQAVREFAGRFRVREVRYDPYQFARSAATLSKAGIRMQEYAQTIPHLTAMGSNLYELLTAGDLVAYEDAEVRLAFQRAVGLETARGFKIAKEKANHRIDVVVALAIAALGAIEVLAARPEVPASAVQSALRFGSGWRSPFRGGSDLEDGPWPWYGSELERGYGTPGWPG